LGGFGEDLEEDNGVVVDMVENAPGPVFIADAQLVAAGPDVGHRTGMRQADVLALLQTPEQHACLQARFR